MTQRSVFRYFKASPEIIRLAVMLYVRYPVSLWNVEDLLHTNAGLRSATRQCSSHGVGWVPYSPPRSGESGADARAAARAKWRSLLAA
jgi:hypothetical protein